MPPEAERLRHVEQKLIRAQTHLADLESRTGAFMASRPVKVGWKHDEQSRRLIYYIARIDPIPVELALIAGDAIQNLMTALDHLAYQLVCKDTGDKPPNPRKIYFPIADDVRAYERNKSAKLEGAENSTIEAIDNIRPYKGGNDHLWLLHRLNNIEKHRLLLTVGAQAAGLHFGQLVSSVTRQVFTPEAAAAFESADFFLMPADKGFPLAPGFQLHIGDIEEAPNPQQQFRFVVALNEPGLVEGQPLIATVRELVQAVETAVTPLKSMLAA